MVVTLACYECLINKSHGSKARTSSVCRLKTLLNGSDVEYDRKLVTGGTKHFRDLCFLKHFPARSGSESSPLRIQCFRIRVN
jgi:hypothetical protein